MLLTESTRLSIHSPVITITFQLWFRKSVTRKSYALFADPQIIKVREKTQQDI